jgi:RHS repeat-associated protein
MATARGLEVGEVSGGFVELDAGRLGLSPRTIVRFHGPLHAQLPEAHPSFVHSGFGAGPVVFTDGSGHLLEERRYEPFGAPIDARIQTSSGPVVGHPDTVARDLNELNKRTDAATGWSDHGARWLAPETGRWLTTDPLVIGPNPSFMAAPWALHPYQYVNQNPVAYWDPDGRQVAAIIEQNAEVNIERLIEAARPYIATAVAAIYLGILSRAHDNDAMLTCGGDAECAGFMSLSRAMSEASDNATSKKVAAQAQTRGQAQEHARAEAAASNKAESGGCTSFLHGTSKADATSIVATGLKAVSGYTGIYPPGSFFTFAASEPLGLIAASHMGLRHAADSNDLSIVDVCVPNDVLSGLRTSGAVKSNFVPGTVNFPPETVFLPQALPVLNESATFSTRAPEL